MIETDVIHNNPMNIVKKPSRVKEKFLFSALFL